MSKDSLYQHHMWHVEDQTLTIFNPKLELLLDFDPPSQFCLPANAPTVHGIRRGGVAAGTSSTARTMTAFGRIGGAGQPVADDLVAEWLRIPSLPPMTDAST
ncbi:hypothetical protein AGDE_03015 [Angomonas deanei]|uniref:Uncharacterized protein n=1 Tax=Angomonas deanei TaxID=59799 RepID=S9V7E0_9TRYP|nr:hypothetical protein AGDE_06948 [Angomonas deanei]EPY38937.1 hypothetical protein AGDE_04992 [Angomonas deanei]EPY40911.1 hypothetical protein AGDE_03015 [Angomonas deanei]CAD2221421.1 hypothetical protein, conserved [Angomonas deanei]|eukprot:EPY36368.1 hypothetical protein AGDE_06948 [Angomonas deanei]